MQLHHTAIVARDLERSIDFYTRLFGFRVKERGEFAGQPLAFLVIAGGMIELVQEAGGPRSEGVVNHIALLVADLPAEIERLRLAGVRFLDEAPVPIYTGGRIAFVAGPDGELIELMATS
jgi:lactoylglutathione lyase